MWDVVMDPTTASTGPDCDCTGAPPPVFMLPPPPRPPFLQTDFYCNEDPLPDIEICDALPMIDASYHSSPSLKAYSVIILCSVVLCFVIFISIILVWKHKRKVQNFLPCKTSPTNHCTGSDGGGGAGVIYEDLNDIIPRPTPTQHHQTIPIVHHHHHLHHIAAPSIEMIDVKNGLHYATSYPISPHSPPPFLCSSPGPDPYCSQDLYNPVYEELSDADSDIIATPHSEDEFAEDELSLGDTDRNLRLMAELHCPPPPYSRTGSNHQIRRDGRSLPPGYRRQQQPLPPVPGQQQNYQFRRPRSLDRRRNLPTDWKHHEHSEFHEGMLLDALLQLYPRVGCIAPNTTTPRIRNGSENNQNQRLPYLISENSNILESGSMSPHQSSSTYDSQPSHNYGNTTFRPPPKPHSQDSALGSDSGYSNHTAGTRNSASSGSNRGRRDHKRLSQLSADLALT